MPGCRYSAMKISLNNSESALIAGVRPAWHTGIGESSHSIISAATAMVLLNQRPGSMVCKITDASRLIHSTNG
tara:strand:- start:333 stop:551 length:219 start_codon:yes stop_codon:yes gene_type:complete